MCITYTLDLFFCRVYYEHIMKTILQIQRARQITMQKEAVKLYRTWGSLRKVGVFMGKSHEWVRTAVYTYPQLFDKSLDKSD